MLSSGVVILALQTVDAVHLGINNLNVVQDMFSLRHWTPDPFQLLHRWGALISVFADVLLFGDEFQTAGGNAELISFISWLCGGHPVSRFPAAGSGLWNLLMDIQLIEGFLVERTVFVEKLILDEKGLPS